MTIVETRPITGGVDTHLDVHVAAALDGNGGVLGVESFPTTTAGFAELHAWLASFGTLCRVGVEGTGAYGAGLARFLRTMDVAVIEVGRPNRQARRAHGKSDTIDAVEAARAALSGRATAVAKTADGNVEAIRVLMVAYRSGRDARIKCLNQLRHLGFCAPDELRERFRGVTVDFLAETAAALRPNRNGDPVLYATKLAMQTLGRRVVDIDADCARLHGELTDLVKATAPSLLDLSRCRHPHRRPIARRRRRQRRTDHLRGRLRSPLRGRPDPRLVWQDDPSSAQPGRQPAGQPRPVADRVHPHEFGPADPRLRRTTHSRRPLQARDHACPQALRRPRGLSPPPRRVAPMIGAAGLAPEMPARHHGCPANDLPTRHSTPTRDTAWPDKSLPSHSSGPSLVCQHRRRN